MSPSLPPEMSRTPAIAAGALSIAEGRPIEECLAEIVEGGARDVSPVLFREVRALLGA